MKIPTITPAASAVAAPTEADPPPPVIDIPVSLELPDLVDMGYLLSLNKLKPRRRPTFIKMAIVLCFFGLLSWTSSWITAGGEKTVSGYFSDLFSLSSLPLPLVILAAFLFFVLLILLFDTKQKLEVRRVTRQGGHDIPLKAVYRLQPAGILRTEPDYQYIVPWGRLHPLRDEEAAYIFAAHRGTESIYIPKKGLDPAHAAHIVAWDAYRNTYVDPPHAPCIPAELAGSASFQLDLPPPTVEQITDMTIYGARRARTGPIRFIALALLIVVALLAYPAANIMLWGTDPYRLPIEVAAPLFLDMLTSTFVIPTLVIAGFIVATLVLMPLFVPFYARKYARDYLASYAQRGYSVTIGEKGVRVSEDVGSGFYGWPMLNDFSRIKGDFCLRFGRGFIILLPFASMTAENVSMLEAAATQALSRKEQRQ